MNYTAQRIPYERTDAFSKLVIDYLNQGESLQPFYSYPVSIKGIRESIKERKQASPDRKLLVSELKSQYKEMQGPKVLANIDSLLKENTFTITTAHQPNIFTGYLYFIYKIIHVIKLADALNHSEKYAHFVPVFYLGSEDNDLEELNRINLNGDTLIWDTNQAGAVGRMNTKGLDLIIERISGELSVLPNGPALVTELKDCYLKSNSIQEATFRFVHYLFKDFGLVTLIPDNQALKRQMIPIFEDDILQNVPSEIVSITASRLEEKYHSQVNPREVNLFYLIDGVRERIIQTETGYRINNSDIRFTRDEIVKELHQHTERFSPNVVLRGIFQESILPNIAFIGGGSEIAYWLELQDMFHHYRVPYPLLVMRNSFLIIDLKSREKMENLGLSVEDLFKDETELMNELVKKKSNLNLSLENELNETQKFYSHLRDISGAVDPTLVQHVIALEVRAFKALEDLEKKMLKAERKKFEIQQSQIQQLKSALFPHGDLQERVENILPYFAKYGSDFIQSVYDHSPTWEQEFTILTEC